MAKNKQTTKELYSAHKNTFVSMNAICLMRMSILWSIWEEANHFRGTFARRAANWGSNRKN